MIGPEPGGPDPAGFAGARLRLLLCRLSTYAQVLPSVTHRALLWAARAVPGVYADVACRAPGEPRARGADGGWCAAACGEPARRFDVLGITLTVPQEALNLPRLLHASGVPLGAAARAAAPDCPLVLLGGHSAAVAPFLHGPVAAGSAEAGLVDAVVVGDGLSALRELLPLVIDARARGAARAELLDELARRVPGVYVPARYEHVRRGGRLAEVRAVRADLPFPVPRRDDPPEAWRGYDGAFIPWSDQAGEETLPVAAGCPHRCRFCRDGWTQGPHRQAPADLAVELAVGMKASLAAADLNLLSPDLGCQRDLGTLVARLLRVYPRISAKSLAGISLIRSPLLAALLPRLGKREISIGVEGASARLRRYLGKRFDAAALPGLLGPMARAGLRQAKLFFIATGLEDDADGKEAGALLAAIARAAPRLRLLASAMPLFPAPGTPLGFAPLRDVRAGLQRLAAAARDAGVEFRVSASPEEIRAAALLTRAGRAGTAALVRASIEHRITYEDELRPADAALLLRLLAEEGLDLAALAAGISASAPCPWDDLDLGVPRRTLHRRYAEAEAELRDGPPAPPPTAARTATVPAVPAAGVAIPDPFAERSTRALVFRVAREAAGRPDATLARGALREWFLRDAPAAAAFAGLDAVFGVPGAYGLRAATVEFAGSFASRAAVPRIVAPPAGRAAPALPVELLATPPSRPWLLAVVADAAGGFAALRRAVERRRPAVRHRVDSTGPVRRLLVERGYWHRCGLAAAHAAPSGLRLFLSSAAGTLVAALAEAGAPPECVALLDADPPAKCPRCRGPAFHRHLAAGAAEQLVCPACDGLC